MPECWVVPFAEREVTAALASTRNGNRGNAQTDRNVAVRRAVTVLDALDTERLHGGNRRAHDGKRSILIARRSRTEVLYLDRQLTRSPASILVAR